MSLTTLRYEASNGRHADGQNIKGLCKKSIQNVEQRAKDSPRQTEVVDFHKWAAAPASPKKWRRRQWWRNASFPQVVSKRNSKKNPLINFLHTADVFGVFCDSAWRTLHSTSRHRQSSSPHSLSGARLKACVRVEGGLLFRTHAVKLYIYLCGHYKREIN